jgi:hypothetical protein
MEGQAREEAVKAIRDMAVQSGMLTEADRNARAVIERVLLLAGYEKVVFVDTSPQPVTTPIPVATSTTTTPITPTPAP